MKRAAIILLSAMSLAFGLVQAYSVEPVKASWSGFTDTVRPYNYVSQTVTCCWDQLDSASGGYVELFVGDLGVSPANQFKLDVYEYPGGVMPIASHSGKPAQQGHTWLKLPLTVQNGYSFTKGKVYEFRFTRSGTDSINYYYDSTDAYQYGYMKVGGQDRPPAMDLACRIFGVMEIWGRFPLYVLMISAQPGSTLLGGDWLGG